MGFSVKIDPESLKRCESGVRQAITRVLNSPAFQKEIGDTVIDDIKFQTRKGTFPPPLKQSWVDARTRLLTKVSPHAAFKNSKSSNLTFTGELLDSLQMVKSTAGKFIFKFVGRHSNYSKGKPGSLNEKIAEGLNKGSPKTNLPARNFIKIRKSLAPRLRRIVVTYLRRASEFFK